MTQLLGKLLTFFLNISYVLLLLLLLHELELKFIANAYILLFLAE